MAQIDVFNHLKKVRELGNDNYFTIAEIRDALCILGVSVRTIGPDVIQLERFGYLEIKYYLNWIKEYRIKKEYCNNKKEGVLK